ncbi:MAG: hypothetical protein FJZ00_10490, partial [Candidatus Sericytochromatia bacterium]|nr:hypothetical protein [Candidatus Tanganyikabacteria bacterium]
LAGDAGAARDILDQALAIADAAHNEEESAIIRTLQAELRSLAGDAASGAAEAADAIGRIRKVGNPLELGRALIRAARIYRASGDLDAANQLTTEAAGIFEKLGAALDLAAARALVTA